MTSIRRRKSKFINVQRHKASCGPIAIANVIKWYGIETSYEAVLAWCTGIRAYHNRAGMWPYQMRYALRTLQIPFKVRKKFTIEDLDAVIDSGGCAILVYDTNSGGHAVFIDARNSEGYRAWNRAKGSPPWMSRRNVKKAIKISTRSKGGLYAYIFQPVTIEK